MTTDPAPAFCGGCGDPYPWTEARTNALASLLTEVQGLSEGDRLALTQVVPDLQADAPGTALAVVRWKGLLSKAKGPILDGIKKVLTEIATSEIKKQIGI